MEKNKANEQTHSTSTYSKSEERLKNNSHNSDKKS
jgi:hypothetical protein